MMTQPTGADLVELRRELENGQSALSGQWNEAMARCLPWMTDKLGYAVQDSLGYRVARELASGLFSNTWAPDRQNYAIELGDKDDDQSEPREWANRAAQESQRKLNASNWAEQYAKALTYAVSNGQAATFVGWRNDVGLYFCTYTVPEIAYRYDRQGRLEMMSRRFKLRAYEVVNQWGAKAPAQAVKDAQDAATRNQEHEFIHLIMARKARQKRKGDALNAPWASYYVATTDSSIVEESGYSYMPYAVLRFYSTDTEYAIGPGVAALPDLRQLDRLQEDHANAVEMGICPPVFVPGLGTTNEIKLRPGAVNPYNPAQGVPIMYTTQYDMPAAIQKIADLRSAIEDEFLLRLLYNVTATAQQATGADNRTAREIEELVDEKILGLAPIVTRLHNQYFAEVLPPVIRLCVEHGDVDAPPERLTADGQADPAGIWPSLAVRYQSRLASRLNAAMARNAIEAINTIAGIEALAQQVPTLRASVHLDKLAREVALTGGVKQDLIPNDKEAKTIRDDIAQAQAEAQQAELLAKSTKPLDTQKRAEDGSAYQELREGLMRRG